MNTHISNNTFEVLYLKEKQKSKLLTLASAVLAVGLLGSFYYHSGRTASSADTNSKNFGNATDMQNGMGGPGGQMETDITDFFNSDGSVNTDEVETYTERMSNFPSGNNIGSEDMKSRMLERMDEQIDDAVDDGDITSDQASKLKTTLGIEE